MSQACPGLDPGNKNEGREMEVPEVSLVVPPFGWAPG